MNIDAALLEKLAATRLVIFDVDGVLTNGQLFYTAQGEYFKAFHVQDGLGLKLLQKSGIKVAIITGRQSEMVEVRMRELGITDIYQGQEDKKQAFHELLEKYQLPEKKVAYVGDDLPDLPLIKAAGVGFTVANAQPIIKEQADYCTQLCGGEGAAREICNLILSAQGKL